VPVAIPPVEPEQGGQQAPGLAVDREPGNGDLPSPIPGPSSQHDPTGDGGQQPVRGVSHEGMPLRNLTQEETFPVPPIVPSLSGERVESGRMAAALKYTRDIESDAIGRRGEHGGVRGGRGLSMSPYRSEPVYRETTEPIPAELNFPTFDNLGLKLRLPSIRWRRHRAQTPPEYDLHATDVPSAPTIPILNTKQGLRGDEMVYKKTKARCGLGIPDGPIARPLYYELTFLCSGEPRDSNFPRYLRNKAKAVRDKSFPDVKSKEWAEAFAEVQAVLVGSEIENSTEMVLRSYGEPGFKRVNLVMDGCIISDPTMIERLLRPLFPNWVERRRIERPIRVLPKKI